MIAEQRAQLVQLLGGLDQLVHPYVPEQVAAPCVIVQPGDPFVVEPDDRTFAGELAYSWDVVVLVELDDENSNEQAGAALDDLTDKLLQLLADDASWTVTGVQRPGPLVTLEWVAHGQTVTVQQTG